uniref:Acyl_transf_3 domain-containing protein n=1 Tax=Steinernema glaseri TaxID=37863 RepID=A0A1I8A2W5_9BILA
MVADVLSLYNWTNGTLWNLTARAAYSALSKPAWGAALSWIIYACFYGHGGPINSFMSWEIWVPLGRLSYCAYLIHMCIAIFLPGMKQGDIYYTSFVDAFVSFLVPIIGVTFFFALFWSAAFEVSFAKVEAILISSLMNQRERRKVPLEEDSCSSSPPESLPPDMKNAVSIHL